MIKEKKKKRTVNIHCGLRTNSKCKFYNDNQNDKPIHADADRSNDDTAQPGNLKLAKEPKAANTTIDTAGNNDNEKACIFANTPPEVRNLMNNSP